MVKRLLLLLVLGIYLVCGVDDFPPRQNVLQVFLFYSTGPLKLLFQDTFCPGLATLIWDNDVFLGTTPSAQTYCGISVRGDSSVIVEPQFTSGEYPLAAGFHNLTVLVYGSPTPNGKATVRLTLEPQPGTQVKLLSQSRQQLTHINSILPRNRRPINWLIHNTQKKNQAQQPNDGLSLGNGRIRLL